MGGMPAPEVTQVDFRGREDDGVENLDEGAGGATNIAAINADFTQLVDVNFRMRFLLSYSGNLGNQTGDAYSLSYSHNLAAYKTLQEDGDGNVIETDVSTFITQAADCTFYTGSLSTGPNQLIDNNGQCESPQRATGVTADLESPFPLEWELEFVLHITGVDVSEGDTIDLQVRIGNTVLFSYTNIPQITVTFIGGPSADPPAGLCLKGGGLVDLSGGGLVGIKGVT